MICGLIIDKFVVVRYRILLSVCYSDGIDSLLLWCDMWFVINRFVDLV